MLHVADLEDMVLSERSQSLKDRSCRHPLTRGPRIVKCVDRELTAGYLEQRGVGVGGWESVFDGETELQFGTRKMSWG